jgi:hypothetical protein
MCCAQMHVWADTEQSWAACQQSTCERWEQFGSGDVSSSSLPGAARALRQDPWAAPTADADPDLNEWELGGSFPEVDPAALLRIEWGVVCHDP